MRDLFLSFSHSSPILFYGLLVLSTHFLWAQGTLPVEKVQIQFIDTPAPFVRVSEIQTRFTYRRSPLTFEKKQVQTDSQMSFFPHYPDYRPPTANAVLYPTRTATLWNRETYPVAIAPSKRWTFAPSYGNVPHETTWRAGTLEDYGHRIPWVGSSILRIGQQVKAHPHVTRLLKSLKPRL